MTYGTLKTYKTKHNIKALIQNILTKPKDYPTYTTLQPPHQWN